MSAYKHILIVDDSPTSRMIIERCVQMCGLEPQHFYHAENGIDALGILSESTEIDLIITDINMPKMDGQTFVRLIKNRDETRTIPVIITSSIADSSFEPEMSKLGVLAVVKKPVSPEKLVGPLGVEQ